MYDFMYMSCCEVLKLTREATHKSDIRGVASGCHSAVSRAKRHLKATHGGVASGCRTEAAAAGYSDQVSSHGSNEEKLITK